MRERLAKLAFVGGLLRAGVAAGKAVGNLALKHPGKAAGAALTGGLAGASAVGTYRQTKAGFDPSVRKAMLGEPPTPPGAQ
jgi:hypothetical protein